MDDLTQIINPEDLNNYDAIDVNEAFQESNV